MKKQGIPLRNSLCLLLTATVWGVAFVAQSVGMDYVGGFTFNMVRCLIGAAALLPVIWLLGKKPEGGDSSQGLHGESGSGNGTVSAGTRRDLLAGGIACGVLLCAASNFQQFGIKYTSSVGKAGFITACYIVLVPILGLFMKKRCSAFIWVAVGLAVVGLYLLCITDGFSIERGDVLLIICAVLFSLHILVVDYFSPKVDGVRMSCIQFLVCGILSGIPALLWEKPQMGDILAAWKPILYSGVMSCGVGYTLQIVGQKNMNPTVASLILSLESCISVLAGWIILGQHLSSREMLGCLVMFGAIVLAQLPGNRREGTRKKKDLMFLGGKKK